MIDWINFTKEYVVEFVTGDYRTIKIKQLVMLADGTPVALIATTGAIFNWNTIIGLVEHK